MKLLRTVQHSGTKRQAAPDPLFATLITYWPLYLIFAAIALTGGWLYLQMTPPRYESRARILIKDEKKGAEEAKALEAFQLLTPKKSVDNELEVIHSKTLIGRVVDRLSLYAPTWEEGQFRSTSAYLTSPVRIQADSATGFKPVKKVSFTTTKDGSIKIGRTIYPLDRWVSTPYGRLRFLDNPKRLDTPATGKFYFSLIPVRKVTDDLAARIDASAASKLSSIIDLTVTDEVPQRGEDILNNLIYVYDLSLVEQNNALAANTLNFVDQRLRGVQAELQAVEQKQQSYRSAKGAIDIGTQGKLFLQNVSNNDQKVGEINMQLSVLNQLSDYVRSRSSSKDMVPSTVGINDVGLTQMVSKLADLQLEVESLKKTAGENNPMVAADQDRIDKIKPAILENIESQKKSLLASRNNLSATNGNYSATLQGLPETERNLVDIDREQTIKNGIYTFLLQKKEETALSYVNNAPGSQLVDKAESSDTPVAPKGRIVYAIALLLALIVGTGTVFAKESISGKIMFRHDIENLTSVPVVAEIAADRSENIVVIGDRNRTLIAEQFRRLRTTLNYLGIGAQKKRILVTSAISGEGKSFIALNLAMSLAMTGKRVALVDFDLNKPSLSARLNMPQAPGVSEFLNGKVPADVTVRPTDLHEQLFFVGSGALPDNPAELMTNGMAREFLDQLGSYFDYLVIDIAPVGPASDAYILSPLCDATLYVIRHAYTPKAFVERLDENNKLNQLTNAAIVFNGVARRGFAGRNYGYGYGYVHDTRDYNKKLSAG